MAYAKSAEKNKLYCYDCGCKITIAGDEIKNGNMVVYEVNGEKITIFKCAACLKKNPALQNYQQCEVYTRVVGYLRPVQQWHKGKKQEYGERVEYNMPKEPCC